MRKRLLSLGLIMVLCFSLTGCKSSDYKKAVEFPNIAVVVDERAKLAPTFPPKLTALDTPLVAAIELVTALPSVFATAVPTVRPVLFPTVFASPFVIVF